ncbi:MFS transporter [Sphaerisporangium corydalis]|uniref:MFS transporter n=1 Tax=Sphaerisporangium corydalis TaxID=1441875 RepID=A0ABV9EPI2_9ACTN|nr:MFS transporter [Sphaerisporangium corydalis]
MPAALPFRLARTAAFAVVCLGLSVTAHVVAGGTVSPSLALGVLALVTAAVLPLSGRERAAGVILPVLAGLQVVLHLVFSMAHTVGTTGGASGFAPHVHSGLVPGLGMLVAHGWAVVLTALWLARGEAALWGLLRRLGARLVRALLLLTVPERVRPAVSRAAGPRAPRPAVLRHVVSRRGPPRYRTAAAR